MEIINRKTIELIVGTSKEIHLSEIIKLTEMDIQIEANENMIRKCIVITLNGIQGQSASTPYHFEDKIGKVNLNFKHGIDFVVGSILFESKEDCFIAVSVSNQ